MVDDICAADPAVARQALLDAVTGLDEHRVNRVAQEVLDAQGIDVLVADVLVPTLHDIGELSMARYRAVFVAGAAASSSLRHNLPVDPLSDDWREAADAVAARCQETIIAPRPVQEVASVAPAAGEQQVQRT